MNPKVSGPSALSLDGTQMRHVIALLDLHADSPSQALIALDELVDAGRLAPAQRPAIAALFSLGAGKADRLLNEVCADDEAVECLLQLRTHEARMVFVGKATARGTARA